MLKVRKINFIYIFLAGAIFFIFIYFRFKDLIQNYLNLPIIVYEDLIFNVDGLKLLKLASLDQIGDGIFGANGYVNVIYKLFGISGTIIFFFILNIICFLAILISIKNIRKIKLKNNLIIMPFLDRIAFYSIIIPPFFLLHFLIPSKEILSYAAFSLISLILVNKKVYNYYFDFKKSRMFKCFGGFIIIFSIFARNYYLPILALFVIHKKLKSNRWLVNFTIITLIYSFFSTNRAFQYETFLEIRGDNLGTAEIMIMLDNILDNYPFLIIPISFIRYFIDSFLSIVSIINLLPEFSGNLLIQILKYGNKLQAIFLGLNSIIFISFITKMILKNKLKNIISQDEFIITIYFIIICGLIPFSQFRYYYPLLPLYYSQMINLKNSRYI